MPSSVWQREGAGFTVATTLRRTCFALPENVADQKYAFG